MEEWPRAAPPRCGPVIGRQRLERRGNKAKRPGKLAPEDPPPSARLIPARAIFRGTTFLALAARAAKRYTK